VNFKVIHPLQAFANAVFSVRRYAMRYMLCVCLSHAGVVAKRLKAGSRKQRCTIAQGLTLQTPKISANFQRDYPKGAPNKGGVGSNRRFL